MNLLNLLIAPVGEKGIKMCNSNKKQFKLYQSQRKVSDIQSKRMLKLISVFAGFVVFAGMIFEILCRWIE